MYSLFRAVAIIVFLSLLLGVAAGIFIETGAWSSAPPLVVAFSVVALLFTLPVTALFLWSYWRFRAVADIADTATRLAAGKYNPIRTDSSFEELAELGRALEELRGTVLRQRELHHRTTEVMQEILNGLGEGLLAVDRERRVVLANRRFAELSGVSPMVGRPLLEAMRNAAVAKAFDRALAGEPSVEQIRVSVGEEDRQLEMRIVPLSTSSDIAAVALLIDVTRMVRLESMRRDFLADFSHEVRTPLAGLRAAVETLENRPVDEQEEKQLRRIVGRQLSRLERLLDDIRQLSEIEAGEVVLQKQSVELKDLLTDLCDDFSKQLNGSSLTLHIEGDRSWVSVDATRVQQVFGNLIDNAIKHARGATEIRVEVEDRRDQTIGRVIDNGEGIPRAEQERIFSRFYRSDPSRAQKPAGTGLGLAIAKHLVLLHGGDIAVHSSPGSGATFEVRFPKASAA